MRAAPDFMAYVDARWPALLRRAVELGASEADAEEVVRDALSRCRKRWQAADRYGDIDAVVEEALEDAVRRHHGGGQPVVGRAPTQDELDQLAWRRRARTNARVVVTLVPVAALVAGLTLWSARGDAPEGTDRLGNAELTRVENPSETVWYAANRLHLDHVALRIEGLTEMVRIGNGAVYTDDEHRVVTVQDDGSRRVLGHTTGPLRASDESGWVAWSDGVHTEVYDVRSGDRVGQTGAAEVVAVDGDTVYLRRRGDVTAWRPSADVEVGLPAVAGATLVDVRGRKKAFQREGEVEVQQSMFSLDVRLPGRAGHLGDGGWTITATALDGEAALFDTVTAQRLVPPDGATVLAATGVGRGGATYVVQRGAGERSLVDCVRRTGQCTDVARLDASGPVPVLAR
jgi:ketosteroid isomerase-like protein